MKAISIIALASALLFASAASAFAANEATGENPVSPTLRVNVTVQSVIRVPPASGAGCAVDSSGGADYNINFGTVDALNTGSCGSKFSPTTAGSTIGVYYTDYTVTPMLTSLSVTTNTIANSAIVTYTLTVR